MKKMLLAIVLIISLANNVFAHITTISGQAEDIASKTTNLKSSVAKMAIEAFYKAQKHGIRVSKPIVTVIDYSLPSTTNRLWVLDLKENKVLYTSLVAHGKNSGENYTTSFSNRINSHQTSLGLFLTDTTYIGKDGYSLRMKGLEEEFNSNAETRAIVMHGAPYVSKMFANKAGRIGRSFGCQAVETKLAKSIINTIKDRTLLLAYYPDNGWLNKSKFIN